MVRCDYVLFGIMCLSTGVGVAMVTVSLIVCIYYNVIMSYTIYYMVASVSSIVPWSICDPEWANMSTCYVRSMTSADKVSIVNQKKNIYIEVQNCSIKFIIGNIDTSANIRWPMISH